jgi:RNA polymerase sigma-70 factor (ECF subfamily)
LVIGDEVAVGPSTFGELARRHRPLLLGLVRRLLGPAAAFEPEDIVQDVLLKAYRKLDSLRDPERFRPWLVSLCLNHARSHGRRRSVEERALPRLARLDSYTEVSTEALERQERREQIAAALGSLAEEARMVVTMRYLEGMSSVEIGRALDLTPEAVRMRLSRAMRALRERLGGESER